MSKETEAPNRYQIEVAYAGVSGWVEKFARASDAAERAQSITYSACVDGDIVVTLTIGPVTD